MRTKRKKPLFFRFKAKTKIPTFSLIFALSEYERRTLVLPRLAAADDPNYVYQKFLVGLVDYFLLLIQCRA